MRLQDPVPSKVLKDVEALVVYTTKLEDLLRETLLHITAQELFWGDLQQQENPEVAGHPITKNMAVLAASVCKTNGDLLGQKMVLLGLDTVKTK